MYACRRLVTALLVCSAAAAISAAVAGRQHQRYHSDSDDSAVGYDEEHQQHQQHQHRHQQQQVASRYVLNLNESGTEVDSLLSSFNISRSSVLNSSWLKNRANNTAQRPITNREQQKIDEIKEDIIHSIGRDASHSPTSGASRSDPDAVSTVAFYPMCGHHDDTAGNWPNSSRIFFPLFILGNLTPRTRLDMAVLRIYQIPHGRNLPAPTSCSEPNDRVFFTVSVVVKHGSGKDTHYVKRSCDTTTRNVNNSTWIDLDAIEVIRHWQKPIRQGAGGGASNRPVNHGLLLLIDVHDQNNQALNATQYFEPMDCQAYVTPLPWALYDKPIYNISEIAVPHVPRLDLTMSRFVPRHARDRSLNQHYADRFNRLEQLRTATGSHHRHTTQHDYDAADAAVTRRNSVRHHQKRDHQRQQRQRSTPSTAAAATVDE